MKKFEELLKEAEDNIEVNEESCWIELECPYFLGTDNCNTNGDCYQIENWIETLHTDIEARWEQQRNKEILKRFKKGDRVRYVPPKISFEATDYGVVSSVNSEYVFVKFDIQGHVMLTGDEDITAQAVNPEHLIRLPKLHDFEEK